MMPNPRSQAIVSSVSLSRLWTIARNVFREVVRDRILYVIGFYALVLVLATRLLPEVSAGAYPKIVLDLSLGTMELLSVLIVAFVGPASIHKEIDKRTMLVLVSKPISRGELIVGKFLGLWGVLLVAIGVMTLVTFPVALLNQIDIPVASFSIAVGFLGLKLAVLTSIAILLGVFTNSVLAAFLTLGFYLTGSFSQDLLRLGELSENASLQPIATALYLIVPDLLRLDFKNEAIYGMTIMLDGITVWFDVAYGIAYTVFFLAIAIAIFRRRQF